MKKIVVFIVLCTITLSAFGQNQEQGQPRIEVYGSAEQEVTPDIIYVSIVLKEYFKDKNNKDQVTISELEKQLISAISKTGIAKENLTIENVSSYKSQELKKKKDPGFLASKQYKLKVSDLNTLDQIIAAVDEQGLQSTYISDYKYSKIDEIKNQLRVKAIKNAKAKAVVIADALSQQVGKAILVTDDNTDTGTILPRAQMAYKSSLMSDDSEEFGLGIPESNLDFKTTKISLNIRVVFSLN